MNSILIVTIPKSGSEYLGQTLSNAQHRPQMEASLKG